MTDHAALRVALGIGADEMPSHWACYRFAAKLRDCGDALDECIASVLSALHVERPEMGAQVAIDGSDLPAYANGQRFLYNHGPERQAYSDPDASWDHRSAVSTRKGGGFYGYKVHGCVDVATELPVAWQVESANEAESPKVSALLDLTRSRGFDVSTAILDRGYDVTPVYDACEARNIRPIIPLRETIAVKAGMAAPLKCEHGEWTFAESDTKRGASKWRCSTGECAPASVWVRADRTPWSLAPRSGGGTPTASVGVSSAGSVGSRTSGGHFLCECAGSSVCACTWT